MNPLLSRLHPYPFERLRELSRGIVPPAHLRPISLGIGEPRHPTPPFIEQTLMSSLSGLSVYPATAGEPALREAAAAWVQRRYGVALDAAAQVLPVNGTREATKQMPQWLWMEAAPVVAAGIEAVNRGQPVVVPGGANKVLATLTRILPEPLGRAMVRAQSSRYRRTD